ncbi:S53 family peptidase [Nannocystaceae bacterium ST9]
MPARTKLRVMSFSTLLLAGCVDEGVDPGDDEAGEGESSQASDSPLESSEDDEIGESSGETLDADTTGESTSESTESTDSSGASEVDSETQGELESGSESETGDLPDGLEDIPPEQWEPVPNPDGVPSPLPGVYDDLGPADPAAGFRALIGLDLRDAAALEDFLVEVGDPQSDIFEQYLSFDEFMAEHAPLASDVSLLQAWLEFRGFTVEFVATTGMLLHFTGTVGQFNEAFETTLHQCSRKNPQHGLPPFPVYCAPGGMSLPLFVADRSPGVITCDLPAAVGQISAEIGNISDVGPANPNQGLSPARVGRAYDVSPLWQQGYAGNGQKIAVIMGSRPHFKWLQTFWQSFGIVRTNPEIVELLEPAVIRTVEATLNPAWAGAMAPGAELIAYAGPDARNTSQVFVFNEAIARMPGDGASVLTTSFAHREDSEPQVVREMYSTSAAMGAAMGLTLFAASGNSGEPDTPSSSPYVTAVGGTRLLVDAQGNWLSEQAWDQSGSGETKSFEQPPWQAAVAGALSNKRMTADLALVASPWSPYWIYWEAGWKLYGGTSFASPTMSGIAVVMNEARLDQGMNELGFLNPKLYWTPEISQGMRDIQSGATEDWSAGPGWDVPTGWGTPRAATLLELIP